MECRPRGRTLSRGPHARNGSEQTFQTETLPIRVPTPAIVKDAPKMPMIVDQAPAFSFA
jgi:hypothetical protein